MVERIQEIENKGKAEHPGLSFEDAFSQSSMSSEKVPPTPAAESERHLSESTRFSISDSAGSNQAGTAEALVDTAIANLGRKVWQSSDKANVTQDGRLSAAVSVSELLKQNGMEDINEASVRGLYSNLVNRGWMDMPVDQARPGDVIIGFDGAPVPENNPPVVSRDPITGDLSLAQSESLVRGGYGGDAGIVGDDGKIYAANSRMGGVWSASSNFRFSPANPRWQGPNPSLHVLRAPQTCDE